MKQYQISINKSEALRYLGYKGHEADERITGQLNQSISVLKKAATPACTYRVFELVPCPAGSSSDPLPDTFSNDFGLLKKYIFPSQISNPMSVEKPASYVTEQNLLLKDSSVLLTGKDAAGFLSECHHCILLAATIGSRVDTELRRRQIADMAGAVILDSCASAAIENLCDQIEQDLEKEFENRGLYLTDRFSPGYGDLPISLQPEICRTLSTEKNIGLTVTDSMLMIPSKSVTALIGIADRPQPKKLSGCGRCQLKSTCNYRKAGITCA